MNSTGRKKKDPPKIASNEALLVYGFVPEHSKELEQAVLGALLLDKQAIDEVIALIHSKDVFYYEEHQVVWEGISNLYGANQPIDLLTIVDQLIKNNTLDKAGGAFGVTKLTNFVISSANIQTHCHILLQKYMKRELGKLGGELVSMSYDKEIDDIAAVDIAERRLTEIMAPLHKKSAQGLATSVMNVIKRAEEAKANPDYFPGIPTGYKALDNVTKGWRPSDLIILAARPSVGKTAFAINLAKNAAVHPIKPTKVGFFSLEMSADQLVERIISMETEIWLDKITSGKMDDATMQILYNKGTKYVANLPIVIDDSATLNIYDVKSKVRKMVRDGVGLVIIDYLQLMSGLSDDRRQNREQEISTISRELKKLAKELKIPIIALSQLSREVEKRKEGNKMPQLSDLRESGAIEQDADMVMFLYRPEYYELNSDEMGESTKGKTIVRIAKHRNGSLETLYFRAQLHIQKFVEDEYGIAPPLSSNVTRQDWTPIGDRYEDKDFDSPF